MANKIAPCMGCETRHYKCHGSCEAYKTWKEECYKLKRLSREERIANAIQKETIEWVKSFRRRR